MKVTIAEFEELSRKAKQSLKVWSRSPSVMTRISQVKLGSVRLGPEIRQGPTEDICPSEMKNTATSFEEGRCIFVCSSLYRAN